MAPKSENKVVEETSTDITFRQGRKSYLYSLIPNKPATLTPLAMELSKIETDAVTVSLLGKSVSIDYLSTFAPTIMSMVADSDNNIITLSGVHKKLSATIDAGAG